ncbi:DNA cytosine methyltransferase [Nocardia sp. 2]|uniref:DNA (cytosine-5-)-methyltransferase n=1 Tax=Nocardia acididurans TaxID=2802282 RepID=A0ABS1MIU8_9NOCA|nr:DNA cytosine methyltransferase [Nocardia acididurans]MBL1080254.1 DNA cytosine methyltransferase [Nocardia acididurans]
MLTLMDWFCGAGGSSQGAHSVPGVTVTRAANHWDRAIETHAANFPDTDHYQGDIRTAPVERWPVADLFWASPECPQWSSARGKKRDYDATMQGDLFDTPRDEEADRSRALMEEVPLYLRGCAERGARVLAGVVENVVEVRQWDQWSRWLGEIRKLGYRTRVIALNSMHAQPVRTPVAPQSRDRLYVAYWHESLGRDPDWSKWLRPLAFCPTCEEWVQAMQVFKSETGDMGRYRTQYMYRCPRVKCRNQVLEPPTRPAASVIDWTNTGQRIGDRERPLAEKTMARIAAGLQRYRIPLTVPAGGTWRDAASPVTMPLPARTTRENDGIAIPAPFLALLRSDRPRTIGIHEPLATIVADGSGHALVVPMEGRDGKEAAPVNVPLRTQTTRAETGLAFLPFVAELRGGASDARAATEPLATVTASGNHHALVTPNQEISERVRQALLLPYYGTGSARLVSEPVPAIPTHDRFALVAPAEVAEVDILDCGFRMFLPPEIGDAMAFVPEYIVLGNKREQVRQYGNAVTPPAAEIIVSALVEAVTGEPLERWATAA